jgi:hypothetical protein
MRCGSLFIVREVELYRRNPGWNPDGVGEEIRATQVGSMATGYRRDAKLILTAARQSCPEVFCADGGGLLRQESSQARFQTLCFR